MRKKQEFIVEGKRVFVGLEDSKRTWKLCVRSEGMVVHQTSMPTEYDNLRSYFRKRYPGCEIRVMYEAGFGGFWLHDRLEADGIDCIVTPAHTVTQEKVNKVRCQDWLRHRAHAADEPVGELSGKPKFLYIQVTDANNGEGGGENVNIKIPIFLLKAGLKLGGIMPGKAHAKLTTHLGDLGLDLDKLDVGKVDQFIKALMEGQINIVSDKEVVNIFCK